jgi:outer membrane protein assembly factor BamB
MALASVRHPIIGSAGHSPAVVMTPLISGDFIYTGAFMAGGALIKLVKQGDAFEAQELYYSTKLPCPLGGVVKVGDYFYGSSDPTMICVDFKTGTTKWSERSRDVACLAADGRLYFHAQDGAMGLLEPSPEAYREKGRFTPPNGPAVSDQNPALAYPVIAGGHLYIRDQYSLWCYDVTAAK